MYLSIRKRGGMQIRKYIGRRLDNIARLYRYKRGREGKGG